MMNSCFLGLTEMLTAKCCCLCGTEIISSWKASTLGMNCGCIHKIPSLWLVEIWFVVVYRDLMKSSLAPLINPENKLGLVSYLADKLNAVPGVLCSKAYDDADPFISIGG